MYRIGQKVLKLDGVITEFADIYAPLAQMFMLEQEEEDKAEGDETREEIAGDASDNNLRAEGDDG